MNDDLISRQAAIELITENSYLVRTTGNSLEKGMTLYGITQALNEVPSARVSAEPKTGRWIPIKPLLAAARCSECKRAFAERTNYCPNCGAKMKGV